MRPLDFEIERLRNVLFEMFELVRSQIHLTKEVIISSDHDLSTEVMRAEKRVNAMELSIDRECEQFIAMHTPVASDLRFAISAIKITGSLERIGDHTYRISSFVFDDIMKLNAELLQIASITPIFEELESMLNHVIESLESGDSSIAKKVFKQDKVLDKVNKKLPQLLIEYIHQHPDDMNTLFLLSKTISKLERVGDLIKNIAEEIIFYHDSKVMKHIKKSKQIDKKLGEEQN